MPKVLYLHYECYCWGDGIVAKLFFQRQPVEVSFSNTPVRVHREIGLMRQMYYYFCISEKRGRWVKYRQRDCIFFLNVPVHPNQLYMQCRLVDGASVLKPVSVQKGPLTTIIFKYYTEETLTAQQYLTFLTFCLCCMCPIKGRHWTYTLNLPESLTYINTWNLNF